MLYFSFISHVRAALFFNVLKTLKQLRNAKTICFVVYFSFISHVPASEIKLFISVLFRVVQAALGR